MQTGEKYLNNTSMMTPVTNNIDILHDEDEENKGQEAALSSSPIKNEMAANHPEDEEAEEPDANEPEKPSGRTSRYRFSRNQALAALAALAVVVGTATVISRAASGKTSISSSNLQAAVVQQEVPGYISFGNGECIGNSGKNEWPSIQFRGITTVQLCGTKCQDCIGTAFPSQFLGFYHDSGDVSGGSCVCFVDQPISSGDFDQFNTGGPPCQADGITYNTGSGPILGGFGSPTSATCYKVGGGDSKASKAPKAAKRG